MTTPDQSSPVSAGQVEQLILSEQLRNLVVAQPIGGLASHEERPRPIAPDHPTLFDPTEPLNP